MCNDYERHIEWNAFCAALEASKLQLSATANSSQLPQADDTRVNDTAPIVRTAGNALDLAPLKWGFAPARPGGAPVFNFRSEGRSFAKSKRCVIPASAFFEFTGTKSPKSKWRFTLGDSGRLGVAGLWREGENGAAAFTMLTTGPGEDIAPFHNRQIAVLRASDCASWLYLNQPESELFKPPPKDSLRVELVRTGSQAPSA